MNKLHYYLGLTSVSSSLVYPYQRGYNAVLKLDKDWVKTRLQSKFNRQITSIDNKYAVELMTNQHTPIMVYNHDGEYWLIQPSFDLSI